jgi:hypothetical protein
VRLLGEGVSPQEGLKRLEDYARSMKNGIAMKTSIGPQADSK